MSDSNILEDDKTEENKPFGYIYKESGFFGSTVFSRLKPKGVEESKITEVFLHPKKCDKRNVPLSYKDVVTIVSELDEEEFGCMPLISIFKLAKAIEKFKAENN
jgi:hypothetical protein